MALSNERVLRITVPKLTETCLEYFDKNAIALTQHASFPGISPECLMEILARDSLCIREIDLYHAVIKWARAQLEGAHKRCTGKTIREVLGDALFLIRFPTMHPQEFMHGPASDNILSAEEERDISRYFLSAGPKSCAFSAEPRTGASTLPLRSFTPTYCQKCGTRMSGDTCAKCGCSTRAIVRCDRCDVWIEVDHTKSFAWNYVHNDTEGCLTVAYRCSCGEPNLARGTGRHECKRCGFKVWRCSWEEDILVGTSCRCEDCQEDHYEDYSSDDE